MKSNFSIFSRRDFLERIAVVSTVLVASPTLLLANNSSRLLRFVVLGQDLELAKIINKSDKTTLVEDHLLADVFYVSETYQKSHKYFQNALASGKHLIVESIENDDFLIEICRESGSLLTIVERSKDASKLFERADFYQFETSKSTEFQKIIDTLFFLSEHTKPLNFKIKITKKTVEPIIA